MMDDISYSLFFSNLLTAVIVAFVTVRLSLKQFRTEKWWELKADTYRKIIEALHDQKKWAEVMWNKETAQANYLTTYLDEITTKSFDASKYIDKVLDSGTFILSKDVYRELSAYAVEKNISRESFFEDLDELLGNSTKSLAKITSLAKKELDPGIFSLFGRKFCKD